jgi:hypothetical protein
MAGTEQADRYARRRFITRHDVDDAAASGQPIRVKDRDVVTSEAAQRAADLGVAIERDGAAGVAFGSSVMTSAATTTVSTAPSPPRPVARATSAADLRHAVRAAVLAELGSEPPGLDAAIDRVLKARSR